MAARLKLKLPSLRVTQRSTTGEINHRLIPRGCTAIQNEPSDLCHDADKEASVEPSQSAESGNAFDAGIGLDANDVSVPLLTPTIEPSLHVLAQKAAIASWSKLRPDMLKTAIEYNAMPLKQKCILCSTNDATYRCLKCAPSAYYCPQCFGDAHRETNYFHTGEVWEDGLYRPVVMNKTIDVRKPHCECPSTNLAPMCCITENGEEHNILFVWCACEPLVLTMVRARIWPSTPQRPNLAFTFDLLDWAESLLLECQVALKDFCKALCLKCPHLVKKRKNFYSSLIDAFEEYRWMKVELRHLTSVCPQLDRGNMCPACPKNSGTAVFSMDALFGLPRKKSAGSSYRGALHGDLFFGSQAEVDEHVASYKNQKIDNVCNNFLAGDTLRSSKRYQALDETALFGCACRHEFPRLFISLKHGERLSYGVWLLQELLQHVPSNVTLYIMYDVACTLVKHLKGKCDYLLDYMKFALPSFHAYGHNASCQAVYSPLRCKGIGLSDGEVMERLWSYLRRFTRMTKEMRSSHRVDILSHALLYYGRVTKNRLASLLANRFKKATEMNILARQDFSSLCTSLSVSVTTTMVESWIEEEKVAMTSDVFEQTITTEWKSHYFQMLQSFYFARDQLTRSPLKQCSSLREKVFNMDCKLADMERRFGVMIRWNTTDKEYMDARRSILMEKQSQLHSCLWATVVKRHYLLQMKAKYADGQKIAKKLSTSISKETKRAKQLLVEYNEACSELHHQSPTSLLEILSPSSDFWARLSAVQYAESCQVPWKVRRDIVQAYLLMQRSEEEKQLLKDDMYATLTYWLERIECIAKAIKETSFSADRFSRGATCSLQQLKWEAELHLSTAIEAFGSLITIPTVVMEKYKSDFVSEDSSDSDSSCDSSSDSDSDLEDVSF